MHILIDLQHYLANTRSVLWESLALIYVIKQRFEIVESPVFSPFLWLIHPWLIPQTRGSFHPWLIPVHKIIIIFIITKIYYAYSVINKNVKP